MMTEGIVYLAVRHVKEGCRLATCCHQLKN